jgi:hypothetical protein
MIGEQSLRLRKKKYKNRIPLNPRQHRLYLRAMLILTKIISRTLVFGDVKKSADNTREKRLIAMTLKRRAMNRKGAGQKATENKVGDFVRIRHIGGEAISLGCSGMLSLNVSAMILHISDS